MYLSISSRLSLALKIPRRELFLAVYFRRGGLHYHTLLQQQQGTGEKEEKVSGQREQRGQGCVHMRPTSAYFYVIANTHVPSHNEVVSLVLLLVFSTVKLLCGLL